MTGLFLRFYLSVLLVLFIAWLIHGSVQENRAASDLSRVIVTAHGGGARLVASELNKMPEEAQQQRLAEIQASFQYPLQIIDVTELPQGFQQQLSAQPSVHRAEGSQQYLFARLSNPDKAVRLGPFPDYEFFAIEDSIRGWIRLAAKRVDEVPDANRAQVIKSLESEFYLPLGVDSRESLPASAAERLTGGAKEIFFRGDDNRWYAAKLLAGESEIIRFGPFPSFENIEQKAATTTLALVLLPAAIAIALLLRPVARQLKAVEGAALSIADGDLSVRVDERRVRSARPLAQAFNQMAERTETTVRSQRELLQAVSHELRTPLARMRFAIDLIDSASDEEERRARLDSLDASAEDLDELVGELLSYVRMDSQESQLHLEQTSLTEPLNSLVEKQAELHPNLNFNVDESLEAQGTDVLVERQGLKRVISNLLSNASRYANERVNLCVTSDQEFVTIDVDDDGPGIPVSERQRVLQPFVWLEDSDSTRGTGLGLALADRILKRHGGSIEITESPLGGCRVRTRWPQANSILHP